MSRIPTDCTSQPPPQPAKQKLRRTEIGDSSRRSPEIGDSSRTPNCEAFPVFRTHEITNKLTNDLTTTYTGKPPPTPPTCGKLDTNAQDTNTPRRPAPHRHPRARLASNPAQPAKKYQTDPISPNPSKISALQPSADPAPSSAAEMLGRGMAPRQPTPPNGYTKRTQFPPPATTPSAALPVALRGQAWSMRCELLYNRHIKRYSALVLSIVKIWNMICYCSRCR